MGPGAESLFELITLFPQGLPLGSIFRKVGVLELVILNTSSVRVVRGAELLIEHDSKSISRWCFIPSFIDMIIILLGLIPRPVIRVKGIAVGGICR